MTGSEGRYPRMLTCTASDKVFQMSKQTLPSDASLPIPAGIETVYVHPCFMDLGSFRNIQWSSSLVRVWSVFIGLDLRQAAAAARAPKDLSSFELTVQAPASAAAARSSLRPNTTSVSSPSTNVCPRYALSPVPLSRYLTSPSRKCTHR